MKRAYFLLSFATLVATGPLQAAELYEDRQVTKIEIVLDSPEEEQDFNQTPILSRLKTKKGDEFSQLTFDSDLKTLSEEYDRVDPTLELKDGGLQIVIHVAPKPVIHQIQWSGNEHIRTKTLQKELGIQPNTVFNRTEFNKAFTKLKEYYIKKSYFESVLTYRLTPIQGSNQVDIEIDIHEGRPGIIQKIVFNGFTKKEQSDLRDQIYLKKYNFLTSWLTGTGYLRDEALEQDRMTILTYLHNKGYADARLDIQLIEDKDTGKLIVDITAHRGTLYHFGQIRVEGNQLIPLDDIMKRSLVKDGEVYSPEKMRETAQIIKDMYGQKGYIDANVQFEPYLAENEPIFNVDFIVEEGGEYKIGLVHIFGNYSTKSNVILRESLLVPGETFDSRKLKATQQRLENMGYFKSVNVYAVRTSDDEAFGDNYRDVYIEVEETTTGNISLFMGFSSTDDVYGGLELTERNFNFEGIGPALGGKLSSLRGGGEYFHARATVGKKQTNYLISWMNPYVNDSLWRFGFELSRTSSELMKKQNIHTYGGSVFANYPLSNFWTVGMRQRIRHTDNRISESVTDGISETLNNDLEQHGLVSAFSGNINYDSTDNPMKPHRGWRAYGEAEIVGIGGSYDFAKFSYINSIYVPAYRYGTFKFRADFKFILPFGQTSDQIDIPLSERFFLGGDQTVRGYKPFSIGKFIGNSDSPLGGISSTLLSFEYNQEIFRMLDVFVFFDAGSISTSRFKITKLNSSVGVGARLDIGNRTPIMVGWGYPINAKKHQRQGIFFSMGGQF